MQLRNASTHFLCQWPIQLTGRSKLTIIQLTDLHPRLKEKVLC